MRIRVFANRVCRRDRHQSNSYIFVGTRTIDMTATAAAIKRLDDLFQNIRLEEQTPTRANGTTGKKSSTSERVHFNPIVITKDCDIHGRRSSTNRRGSIGPRRESMPAGLNSIPFRRRESLVFGSPSQENLCHPSGFASTLRKDSVSLGSLKRNVNFRKDSYGTSKREAYTPVGGNAKMNGSLKRDYVNNGIRKDSASTLMSRRFSTDSLDSVRRNSWDPTRRESSGSSAGFDDPIWEENSNSFNDEVCSI